MAFSMFARSSVCGRQLMKLASQPTLQRSVTTALTRNLALKNSNSTPILNAVRSFRTSAALRSADKTSDHSRLWVIERAVALALVPVVPAALLMPNQALDSLLAVLVVAHTFWGLEAIAVDYVRASIFGPVIPKLAIGLVYALSIATLGGLFYIISHDIGIGNTIRSIWAIKSGQKA